MADDVLIHIKPNIVLSADMPPPESVDYYEMYLHDRKTDRGDGYQIIGTLKEKNQFSSMIRDHVYFESEKVKEWDCNDIVLPMHLRQFSEAISLIFSYEARHDPWARFRSAALTIRQTNLSEGDRQDTLDWHSDGNPFKKDPFTCDHIYMISDVSPTLAQVRPLKDAFNRLSGITEPREGLTARAEPYQIVLMTDKTYHRSLGVNVAGRRTFLRMNFSSPRREDAGFTP